MTDQGEYSRRKDGAMRKLEARIAALEARSGQQCKCRALDFEALSDRLDDAFERLEALEGREVEKTDLKPVWTAIDANKQSADRTHLAVCAGFEFLSLQNIHGVGHYEALPERLSIDKRKLLYTVGLIKE